MGETQDARLGGVVKVGLDQQQDMVLEQARKEALFCRADAEVRRNLQRELLRQTRS